MCRICDETGVADAAFSANVKKHIEENQVYTVKYAEALVVNDKIRIELMKYIFDKCRDKGSLIKEPGVIPFKDATFDLSKREWVKRPKNNSVKGSGDQ
jgi:hypothetical protein